MRVSGKLTALLLLGASAGCLGEIGDPVAGTVPLPSPAADDDPGRVTMRRLNRAEYDNTVRDLLGTTRRVAVDFPTDDYGYGFDNNGDVLSISPLHLELYERAAETLAREALAIPSSAVAQKLEAETLTGTAGSATANGWNVSSNGEVGGAVVLPAAGSYKVSARLWGQQAGAEPVKAELSLGGASLGSFDVTATSDSPVIVEATVDASAGSKHVAVAFLNDFYEPASGADRNLVVDWIQVEGPLGAAGENDQRERIVTCALDTGEACVRKILGDFAGRAFRRPATAEEVDGLMALVSLAKSEGDSVDVGLELAVRAVLVSPHFVFRVELDPDPESSAPHPLSGFELATRLSYFIWSSMPDHELFAAAAAGKLEDTAELAAEVRRMLADPKSDALVENFSGQWLHTRALEEHQPDYVAFPGWDEPLREAMRKETELFFREFLHGDMSIDQMLTADFTFLNDRLAQHYGLPSPGSEALTKVALSSGQRGGLLTQGSVLTLSSFPTRTSPVKRGKWVLGQLLCSEPPPPPAGVEGLTAEETPTGTLRERLEKHREDPVCASCHNLMDPIGFGLEEFDGIGAFRTMDGEFPVDATGMMPTGETFDGAQDMRGLLAGDPRFVECVSQKLYTYALGRGPGKRDTPFLAHIDDQLAEGGRTLAELVLLIAQSEPFRLRRGEPTESGGQP